MQKQNIFRSFLKRNDSSTIIATIVLFIVFSVSAEAFFTPFNLFNVFRSASQNVFIALGQAVVLVVGGMNLSLGSIGGLTTVIVGVMMEVFHVHPLIAVAAGLLVGFVAGSVNGLIITKMGLNTFIVTLATSFVYLGLLNGISKGKPYLISDSFTIIGKGDVGGFPLMLILMIAMLCIGFYVFRFTIVGRHLLATGGNIQAARLSGIKTDRMIMLAHIISGVLASISAMLWISRMGTAQPATGQDWLIVSFAVSILGGTSLAGGTVAPFGFFFSGLLMALIRNGLIMLGVNIYFESTFLGFIILLAVGVDFFRMRIAKGERT